MTQDAYTPLEAKLRRQLARAPLDSAEEWRIEAELMEIGERRMLERERRTK